MPPYKPPYLHEANAKCERTEKAFIDYIDYVEEHGEFNAQEQEKIDRLASEANKALLEYSDAWKRWQRDQILFDQLSKINPDLTIFKFYELGLNREAESNQLPASLQRNEQPNYSTSERKVQ